MKIKQKEESNLHKMNSFVYNYSIEMKAILEHVFHLFLYFSYISFSLFARCLERQRNINRKIYVYLHLPSTVNFFLELENKRDVY